ncbi:hypothetical protein VM1G_08943 [Cytospora mali]|uniref:Rhodopsin domain-containing protein n=1 Tax=Cytospora mali TaxID=578113 RepID=A0A194WAP3_CYTMA|nr:hypothetical protein VM1G_08943 [Valsa mali]
MGSTTVTGASPAPPGITPNFEHPTDVLRTVNYVTQALSLVVVTGFMCLKYYAKTTVLRGTWNSDDFATYAAYVLFVGYCIVSIFVSEHGGGLNQWEVTTDDIVPFFKVYLTPQLANTLRHDSPLPQDPTNTTSQAGYAATIFYAPMAFTVKMALLLIIAKVFGPVHKKTIVGIWVFMALLAGYYISALVVKIRICWPIRAYWEGDTSKCLNQSAIITADAIVSAVSDLVILLMPTPLTWSLQLPLRKKLRVTGILCAGGVATAFSVYRLILIVLDARSTNQTIVFVKVILSGNAEVGIGLICTCLPAVTAIYTRRLGGSGYMSGGYGNRSGSKHWKQDNTQSSTTNQIYVNRSFHMSTGPREEAAPRRHGDPDQLSQDQIELVTHAAWSKE